VAAKPPFRADHVGSLLRPQGLRELRDKADAGEFDRAKLRNLEDDAIRAAVVMQEDAGLHAITDGEMRRKSWQSDFVESIQGAAMRAPKVKPKPGEFVPRELVIEGKLRHAQSIEAENFKFLKSATRYTPKLSMPSPTILLRGGREHTDAKAYPDLDRLDADAAAVYQDELKALGAAGCT
jgi:5-methyltetrahydropteroyltriglutamate--homocysteine methyltransferase